MQKIKCLIIVLFIFTSSFVQAQTTVTQEMLMAMSEQDRNNVIAALNREKAKQLKKITAASENTVEGVLEGTSDLFGKLNVDKFEEKSLTVARGINSFFSELGVTLNDFIKTPAGNMIILGLLYKIGVFGSFWVFIKGGVAVTILLYVFYGLNAKKIIIKKHTYYDEENEIKTISEEEILVPKISAIFSDKVDERSVYAVIGSIVCVVLLIFTFACM